MLKAKPAAEDALTALFPKSPAHGDVAAIQPNRCSREPFDSSVSACLTLILTQLKYSLGSAVPQRGILHQDSKGAGTPSHYARDIDDRTRASPDRGWRRGTSLTHS